MAVGYACRGSRNEKAASGAINPKARWFYFERWGYFFLDSERNIFKL
jgi:hypothetical protein